MDRWITVKIAAGLFPTERTVRFNTAEGEVSVFVSSTHVDEARTAMKVNVIDEDESFALVQVPSQSGLTVAKVPRSVLQRQR